MSNENTINEQLKSLQINKGNICISIILPTHQLSPERKVDDIKIKLAINRVKQLLQHKYSKNENKLLINSIDEIYKKNEFMHNTDGIGLFVSTNFELLVQFPFSVEEKIIVGDSFEVRDLLYKKNISTPYLVILLSRKRIRLYNGVLNKLIEIIDDNFPKTYEEEYEYNSPSRGNPSAGVSIVRNFEKEKSSLQEIRFEQFYRKADKQIDLYSENDKPIIIMGVEKDIAWFKKISKNNKKIKSVIYGNYEYLNENKLTNISWPRIFKYFQNQQQLIIKEIEEKKAKHLVITGVESIWKASQEGNKLKLIVEKDVRKSGFTTNEGKEFHEKPIKKPYETVNDAVDDIMEMVLEKGGQVILTENNTLKDYHQIALITRH